MASISSETKHVEFETKYIDPEQYYINAAVSSVSYMVISGIEGIYICDSSQRL